MTTKIDVTATRGKTFAYGMLVAAGYRQTRMARGTLPKLDNPASAEHGT